MRPARTAGRTLTPSTRPSHAAASTGPSSDGAGPGRRGGGACARGGAASFGGLQRAARRSAAPLPHSSAALRSAQQRTAALPIAKQRSAAHQREPRAVCILSSSIYRAVSYPSLAALRPAPRYHTLWLLYIPFGLLAVAVRFALLATYFLVLRPFVLPASASSLWWWCTWGCTCFYKVRRCTYMQL